MMVNMVLRVILVGIVTVLVASHAQAVDEDVARFRQDRARLRTEAYLEEGKKEVKRGSYFRGIRLLSQAIEKGVGGEALRWRGQAFYLSGMYPEAIADITTAINHAPADPSGHVLLGDVYAAKGENQAALKNYEKAINVDPLFVDAYVGRGITLLSLEKYGPAIKDFQVALQSAPNDASFLVNMASAFLAADMPQEAREFFQKALDTERDPGMKHVLEARIAALRGVSPFEKHVGGVNGYLAKTSASYEGTGSVSFADARTDSEEKRTPAIGRKQTIVASLPVLANLRDQPGRKINVRGSASAPEVSGSWDGSYMGLRWNIDFKATGNTVSAIVKIYSPSGKEDIHHCEGVLREDGYLEASDNKGFRFTGKLTDDYRVVGTVTMGDGKSMNLDMPIE
jgi:tetratricopeptide (TPR) repeat protein